MNLLVKYQEYLVKCNNHFQIYSSGGYYLKVIDKLARAYISNK